MKINRTVKRALDMLQLLASANRPLTSKEISTIMELPVTSAFDILRTLLSEGFVEYSSDNSKSYIIGAKAFEIGSAYLRNTNMVQIVAPYVQRLMQLSNATSFFAIEHHNQIIYMDKAEAPTALRTNAELGSRRNMYSTGLGKAILACYEEDRVEEIFCQTEVVAYTPYTITDIKVLLQDLNQIRKRGFSIDNQEGNTGISCVACAIRKHTGKPIGAISIAMMTSNFTEDVVAKCGSAAAEFAKEISSKLGYVGEIYY